MLHLFSADAKHLTVIIIISFTMINYDGLEFKKRVLRNFAKFIGKHLCQRPFFNKVAGLKLSGTKSLWYRYFPVNFAKFLTPFFFQNTSGRLLLNHTINQKSEDLQLFLDQFWASSGVHFQSGIRFSKLSEI